MNKFIIAILLTITIGVPGYMALRSQPQASPSVEVAGAPEKELPATIDQGHLKQNLAELDQKMVETQQAMEQARNLLKAQSELLGEIEQLEEQYGAGKIDAEIYLSRRAEIGRKALE